MSGARMPFLLTLISSQMMFAVNKEQELLLETLQGPEARSQPLTSPAPALSAPPSLLEAWCTERGPLSAVPSGEQLLMVLEGKDY